MTALFVILSILAYLAIGYGYGSASNYVYLDKRKTETLTFIGKTVRLFFFPFSYHHWQRRGHPFDGEETLRQKCHADSYDDNKNCKGYRKIVSIIWPFYLFPTTLFCFFGSLKVIWWFFDKNITLLNFMVKRVRQLLNRKKIVALTLQERTAEVAQFVNDEIVQVRQTMEQELQKARQQVSRLADLETQWKETIARAHHQRLETSRFETTLKEVSRVQHYWQQREKTKTRDLASIQTYVGKLEFLLTILHLYARTQDSLEKSTTSIPNDYTVSLDTASGLMDACRKMYKLESDFLIARDVDLPTLERQIAEGVNHEADLLQLQEKPIHA